MDLNRGDESNALLPIAVARLVSASSMLERAKAAAGMGAGESERTRRRLAHPEKAPCLTCRTADCRSAATEACSTAERIADSLSMRAEGPSTRSVTAEQPPHTPSREKEMAPLRKQALVVLEEHCVVDESIAWPLGHHDENAATTPGRFCAWWPRDTDTVRAVGGGGDGAGDVRLSVVEHQPEGHHGTHELLSASMAS